MSDNAIVDTTAVSRQSQLAKTSGAFLPVMTIEDAVSRYDYMVQFAKRVMVEGRDYGIIPGTERKPNKDGTPSANNNTLLKPGAEKLCTIFGLVPDFEEDKCITDFEHGLFHFSYKCVLLRNARREIVNGKHVITGDVAGVGIGSCNSREKKYRRGGKACPECGAIAIKRSKYPPRERPDDAPGWYCYDKAGGCGFNFAADDQRVLELANVDDPSQAADLINTIQKMAQKRSLISAALVSTNASEFFTQDLDEESVDHGNTSAQRAGTKPANGSAKKDPPKQERKWSDFTLAEKFDFFKRNVPIASSEQKLQEKLAAAAKEQWEPIQAKEIAFLCIKRGIELANVFEHAEKAFARGQQQEFDDDQMKSVVIAFEAASKRLESTKPQKAQESKAAPQREPGDEDDGSIPY